MEVVVVNVTLGLSLLGLVVGIFILSEATIGVGAIGIAAVLAIYGRIWQADRHHQELKALLKAGMDVEEIKS
jgi:hypothetical protein